jgi:hypothetical protein
MNKAGKSPSSPGAKKPEVAQSGFAPAVPIAAQTPGCIFEKFIKLRRRCFSVIKPCTKEPKSAGALFKVAGDKFASWDGLPVRTNQSAGIFRRQA